MVTSFSLNLHGSARMERGAILICIFSIFSIFVQDAPYFNHAAGSQASMIIGKTLALISLRGVVSSPRLHGAVDTTLLANGSSYGKIPALPSRGVIISSRMNGVFLPAIWITCSAYHRKQEQRPVLSGLPAELLIIRLVPSSRLCASFSLSQFISTQSSAFEAIAVVKPLIIRLVPSSRFCASFSLSQFISTQSSASEAIAAVKPLISTQSSAFEASAAPNPPYARTLNLSEQGEHTNSTLCKNFKPK